ISSDQATIRLDGSNAHVRVGGGSGPSGQYTTQGPNKGQDGKITIQNLGGGDAITLDASVATVKVGGGAGANPGSVFQVDGRDGEVHIRDKNSTGRIQLNGQNGKVKLFDASGNEQIHLNSESGNVELSIGDLTLDKGKVKLKKGDLIVEGGG